MGNLNEPQFENDKLRLWKTNLPSKVQSNHVLIDLKTHKTYAFSDIIPESGDYMVIEMKEPKNRPLPSIPID
ncbi:MAG: hypothetical protein S4CHLAM45_05040 [Chlamydiales bacterium]|nr:hypothetical protein [Chlamydiales bacterium]MCH9619955.1 hypothetical protein [Chlamydiales bacterium]MCH9622618.1 hypothetical protein [Chlamydiales bacterium]